MARARRHHRAVTPAHRQGAQVTGHRWPRLLESGECDSITELAAAEKIDRSYLCRVLRLTLLAPKMVEAIVDGRQPEEVTLPALMKGVPVEWEEQRLRPLLEPLRLRHSVRQPAASRLRIAAPAPLAYTLLVSQFLHERS